MLISFHPLVRTVETALQLRAAQARVMDAVSVGSSLGLGGKQDGGLKTIFHVYLGF